MRSVGIKGLKNKLSEYIRLVTQGETVLVTDRDRVVAELSPPRPGRTESVSDVILGGCAKRMGHAGTHEASSDREKTGRPPSRDSRGSRG